MATEHLTSEARQRYEDLERFLNIAGKSGYVNIKPIIQEMAKILGIPDTCIKDYRMVPHGA